jgi:4-methyl-5(b-hydroxyethyl)-thiazole monophosphate biosynthesis
MSRVCVLLAPGFEEIEAVTVIDVLRRASVDTTIVGVEDMSVTGSHDITLEADVLLSDVADVAWDLVVLPGGMPGAAHLRDSDTVQRLVVAQRDRGGRLAAICAAPIALSEAGVLEGKQATSYPSFAEQVSCGAYLEQPVVVDGDVVTSRAPGTALRFALQLVEIMRDAETAQRLADAMLTSR